MKHATIDNTSSPSRRARSARFKGLWIPIGIALDERFTAIEKMLLAEIYALEKQSGSWASNGHYAQLLGVGERMVRNYITKLEDDGHIRAEARASKRRRLWVSDDLRHQIVSEGIPEDLGPSDNPEPIRQNNATMPQIVQAPTRQDPATEPGNDNIVPEVEFPPSRKVAATENTLRGQERNTKEKSGDLDFSEFPWLPAPTWQEWLDHNRLSKRTLTAPAVQAQLRTLEQLSKDGHPPSLVIQQAIAGDHKTFYPLPSGMKPTGHSHLLRSRSRMINGMLVR